MVCEILLIFAPLSTLSARKSYNVNTAYGLGECMQTPLHRSGLKERAKIFT